MIAMNELLLYAKSKFDHYRNYYHTLHLNFDLKRKLKAFTMHSTGNTPQANRNQ